jgi:hypothetical protein
MSASAIRYKWSLFSFVIVFASAKGPMNLANPWFFLDSVNIDSVDLACVDLFDTDAL